MKQGTIQVTLAIAATAVLSGGAIYAASHTQATPNPAFDAGTRVAQAPASVPPPITSIASDRSLAPQSDLPIDPAFGTRLGDCPTEDSCRADYAGGVWRIFPVVP